jgi:PDZ domain-containing secreted protein
MDEKETQKITVTLGEHPQEKGKAYLGVSYAPIPEFSIESERPPSEIPFPPFIGPGDEGDHFQLPEGVNSAVLVGKVIEGSPADEAGLQKGDLITAIEGESVQALNPKEFAKIIQKHKPGDKITFTVYRNGDEETLEIQATLGEDPEQADVAYLGIEAMGFMKIDKSDDPTREFHFEFKLPEWFHDENRPDLPVQFEIFQSGEET